MDNGTYYPLDASRRPHITGRPFDFVHARRAHVFVGPARVRNDVSLLPTQRGIHVVD